MSYLIGAKGATVADLLGSVAVQLDKAFASQPAHSEDEKQAVQTMVQKLAQELSTPEEGGGYMVNVSGSVGGEWAPDSTLRRKTSAQASVAVYLRTALEMAV